MCLYAIKPIPNKPKANIMYLVRIKNPSEFMLRSQLTTGSIFIYLNFLNEVVFISKDFQRKSQFDDLLEQHVNCHIILYNAYTHHY